jgi:uncharacterized protein with HEPN domain
MKKDDSAYLLDIITCIRDIEKFIEFTDYEQFGKDYKLQLAVVRLLEIIGEASVKLSAELKNRYSTIPWVDIKGLRNRLVHDYSHIRIDVIWNTVTKNVPSFKEGIVKILEDLNPQLLINFK